MDQKKIGFFGLLLLGGIVSADPWICNFDSGLEGWIQTPKMGKVEAIDDANTQYGKALKISAESCPAGINSPFIAVPEKTANAPWTIEYDLRSEGNIHGMFAVSLICCNASGAALKQFSLGYVTPKQGVFDWKHCKHVTGTGAQMFPKGTTKILLRFSFWSQDNKSNGTVVIDNVKVTVPEAGSGMDLSPAVVGRELLKSDFENGMGDWVKDKSKCIGEVVDDPVKGKVLQLKTQDCNGGVESKRIPIPEEDRLDVQTIKFDGSFADVVGGNGALSIRAWSAGGTMLRQIPLQYFRGKGGTGWKEYSARIGGSTGNRMLPEKTAFISLRLSQWSREGKCNGTICLDNVTITTTEKGKAVPAVPKRIVTNVKLPDGWVAAPEGNIALKDDAIVLTPTKDYVGINSKIVPLEGAIAANVTFHVAVDSVKAGKFTLAVLALDAQGKRLKQIDCKTFQAGNTLAKEEFSVLVGDGGIAPFPKGTAALQVRAVFWDKSMECTGVAKIYSIDILPEI